MRSGAGTAPQRANVGPGKRFAERFACLAASLLLALPLHAAAQDEPDEPDEPEIGRHDGDPGMVPDIREHEVPLKVRKGSWVAVPIPFSNPTLGTGLVAAVGHFHAQTEEQKASQPPSVTGAGVLWSESDNLGVAVGNASYWGGDTWRFKGALAWADLDLPLYAGELGGTQLNFDWLIEGTIVFTEIARRVHGNWYLGARARYLDVEQALVGEFEPNLPLYESQIVASGLGLSLEYDTRDMPSNAYEGQHFTASALLNEQTLGSDNDYGVYSVDFTSYHHLSEPFVLAWTASGCTRSGDVPLWDACRLNLRGSTATDYMGRSAVMAKAEGRWHFGNRWGAVVFAGAGKITDPIFEWQDFDVIGNYGAGIRFMVSRENRINLRLDYGRTRYDSAVVLAVGEAF
jgi:hypothetical protein